MARIPEQQVQRLSRSSSLFIATKSLLGHAKLDTTQIYTLVSLAKLKEAHKATHPAKLTRASRAPSLRLGARAGVAPDVDRQASARSPSQALRAKH